MTPNNLLPFPRRVAPGGPVARAVEAGRGEVLSPEHIAALQRFRKVLTRQIESDLARVDRCLDILNLLEGDPDRSADYTTVERDAAGNLYTLGRTCEDEGADADFEPSLGSIGSTRLGAGMPQTTWGGSTISPHTLDFEEEHDGLEPDDDFEDVDAENEHAAQPLRMKGGGYSTEAFTSATGSEVFA